VVRAGDRSPDSAVIDGGGAKLRLFDLFRGPHFTLLVLGGAKAPELRSPCAAAVRVHRIGRRGGAEAGGLADHDGLLHRLYGDGLILVRPDGYIGYAGNGQGLSPYLSRFFG
jgi:hypothetical protein